MHEYLLWAVAWYLSGLAVASSYLIYTWFRGRHIRVGQIMAGMTLSTLGPLFIMLLVGSEINKHADLVVFRGREVPEKSDDLD